MWFTRDCRREEGVVGQSWGVLSRWFPGYRLVDLGDPRRIRYKIYQGTGRSRKRSEERDEVGVVGNGTERLIRQGRRTMNYGR